MKKSVRNGSSSISGDIERKAGDPHIATLNFSGKAHVELSPLNSHNKQGNKVRYEVARLGDDSFVIQRISAATTNKSGRRLLNAVLMALKEEAALNGADLDGRKRALSKIRSIIQPSKNSGPA